MSVVYSKNETAIWQFLKKNGFNDYGCAGLMGNLFAESGLSPINLQNNGNTKLGLTDEQFTKKLDNGDYSKDTFLHDGYGYGLAQWTHWSRKQNFYEFAQSKKTSFGDLDMQLAFLVKELGGYVGMDKYVKNATSVQEASDFILLNYERPASVGPNATDKQREDTKALRLSYGQALYEQYAEKKAASSSQNGGNVMGYSNSSLVDCTVKSPNHSGTRTHKIDRITPHCVVGQLTAESIGGCFTSSSVQASCNYGIGKDGRVCLVVDEKNRSWCSSSRDNDQRAITIECASDMEEPYAFKDAVYQKLVKLCIDICKRNGLNRVLWFGDKNKSLNYEPKSGECVLTVHRWFANKSCPGNWLYGRMEQLANEINKGLGNVTSSTPAQTQPAPSTGTTTLKYAIGNIVDFKGTKHYSSATASSGSTCKPGVAKVTAVYASGKHPYHLVRESDGGSTVYGWVDASDITGIHGAAFQSYMVKVTTSNLNIRKGPGTSYATCGSIKDKGTYTIVKESDGTGASKWGYLKSGAGWISLDYCKKV